MTKTCLFISALLFSLLACAATAQAAGGMSILRDEETESDLRTFCRPIFQQAGVSPEAVRFVLVDQNDLNAFVAGGQNIFIYSGLILETSNPEELIGVVAHETGHIAHGDLFRMKEEIRDATVQTILMSLLGLAGALARAADEDDGLGHAGADLGAVLAEGVERHVVGAGDVLGLELARGANVEEAGVGTLPEEPGELGGREDGRKRGLHRRMGIVSGLIY